MEELDSNAGGHYLHIRLHLCLLLCFRHMIEGTMSAFQLSGVTGSSQAVSMIFFIKKTSILIDGDLLKLVV